MATGRPYRPGRPTLMYLTDNVSKLFGSLWHQCWNLNFNSITAVPIPGNQRVKEMADIMFFLYDRPDPLFLNYLMRSTKQNLLPTDVFIQGE